MASRWRRRLVLAAAGIVAASGVGWAVPQVRARIKALGVVTEAAGIPFPRPWARSVEAKTQEIAPGVIGDMYVGGEDSPVILFVPGAARRGRDDPRVVRAATSLAKADRRVFVPELTLYERTFDRKDIERLAMAIDVLSKDGPIGVLAFSYGGSFALIAAARPGTTGDVAYIATFGAYFDLTNVIQGVTTGSTMLDGEKVPFETVPEAREILTSATIRLAPESYAAALTHAVETEDPRGLPPGARAVYELLTNDEPERSGQLEAALPKRFQKTLEEFSPSTYLDGFEVPVFIMQSKKDAATPWAEAMLLERALVRTRVTLLHHFSHVDPPGVRGWLSDGPDAWWFVSWVLEAQE